MPKNECQYFLVRFELNVISEIEDEIVLTNINSR
jgi:hypothetical protein